eukprot:m.215715 g.215715  ORF g.215715 m.215715 type:complete len:79 (+) comp39839_c1_seq9:430-666(+)
MEHRRNKGLSKDMAILNFLQEVATWEHYKMEFVNGFFQVQGRHVRRVRVGLTKEEFAIFDKRGRTIQRHGTFYSMASN